jgi:hypothetical protein
MLAWAASDGRQGRLTGPGRSRLTEENIKKVPSAKGSVKDEPTKGGKKNEMQNKAKEKDVAEEGGIGDLFGMGGDDDDKKDDHNAGGWTDDMNKKLLDWKAANPNKAWADFATEIGKAGDECKAQFNKIKPNDWKPAVGGKGGGGGAGKKDRNKGNNKGNNQGNNQDNNNNNGNNQGQGQNKNEKKKDDNGWDAGGGNATGGNNDPVDSGNLWGGADSWDFGGNNDSGDKKSNSGDKKSNSGDKKSNSGDKKSNSGDKKSNSGDKKSNSGDKKSNSDDKKSNSGDKKSNSGDKKSNSGDAVDAWGNNDTTGADANPTWGEGTGNDGAADTTGGDAPGWDDPTWAGNATGAKSASKKSSSNKGASNAGGTDPGWGPAPGGGEIFGGWDNTSDKGGNSGGAPDAWNTALDTTTNNAAGVADQWPSNTQVPAKPASKAASKAPSNHHPSRRSSRHNQTTPANTAAPRHLEVTPDDTFSADDLRLVAKILQQDYSLVWNRVSWRFKDKTGRTLHPDVFEKKITGRVEGKGSEKRR